MSVQKQKKVSPIKSPIYTLVNKHPDLLNFFSTSCRPEGYQDLALTLIREAIEHRLANGKHYHVEYIKHKRFFSPKQREAVSPKVTEVIPLQKEPIKIYGKPRVKIDECEMVAESMPVPEAVPSVETKLIQQTKVEKSNEMPVEKMKQSELESQKYLSPCKQLPMESRQAKFPKPPVPRPRKEEVVASKQSIESEQRTLKQNNSGVKGWIGSPKGSKADKYENVQSRIKFLVDRDKHNRKLERQLEEQNKKIGQLQERQEKLLIRQYQQLKETEGKSHSPNKKTYQKEKPEFDCCCCSSDQEITSQLLKMRTSGQQYKNTVSNIQRQLESKVYKISGKPVYPMSSSSQESSQEVVVVGRY